MWRHGDQPSRWCCIPPGPCAHQPHVQRQAGLCYRHPQQPQATLQCRVTGCAAYRGCQKMTHTIRIPPSPLPRLLLSSVRACSGTNTSPTEAVSKTTAVTAIRVFATASLVARWCWHKPAAMSYRNTQRHVKQGERGKSNCWTLVGCGWPPDALGNVYLVSA